MCVGRNNGEEIIPKPLLRRKNYFTNYFTKLLLGLCPIVMILLTLFISVHISVFSRFISVDEYLFLLVTFVDS